MQNSSGRLTIGNAPREHLLPGFPTEAPQGPDYQSLAAVGYSKIGRRGWFFSVMPGQRGWG